MKHTYADFQTNSYYGAISADGHRGYYSGRYEVNYSDILTKLIQEAGRYCEHYASDLFIDWSDGVLHYLDKLSDGDDGETSGTFLFGFRQNGVDHAEYIFSRYDNELRYAKSNYRSMWRLDITTSGRDIHMILGRVF